jgi:hypothetical protein
LARVVQARVPVQVQVRPDHRVRQAHPVPRVRRMVRVAAKAAPDLVARDRPVSVQNFGSLSTSRDWEAVCAPNLAESWSGL